MKEIVNLIRVRHWIKNILVLAPLFFALDYRSSAIIIELRAFLTFCLASSVIYILNDIIDVNFDRIHPIKRLRPIAAGRISIKKALVIAGILLLLAASMAWTLTSQFKAVLLSYFIINLVYSVWLKKYLIIDAMVIACGFIIRVLAGAYAINVYISPWIIIVTFFASLFFAFGKRKNEAELLEKQSVNHRQTLAGYTPDFLNQLLGITAGVTIIGYALYTIDSNTIAHFQTDRLVFTVPLVAFGIFRYFHIIYNQRNGGDPTNIFLTDKPLILTILIWIAAFVALVLVK